MVFSELLALMLLLTLIKVGVLIRTNYQKDLLILAIVLSTDRLGIDINNGNTNKKKVFRMVLINSFPE
jgi:hypothetical protein